MGPTKPDRCSKASSLPAARQCRRIPPASPLSGDKRVAGRAVGRGGMFNTGRGGHDPANPSNLILLAGGGRRACRDLTRVADAERQHDLREAPEKREEAHPEQDQKRPLA
jgi:hypothetical protein